MKASNIRSISHYLQGLNPSGLGLERRDKTNRKTANYNRRQSFISKVCLLFGFFGYLLFVVNEEKKSPLK